MIPGGAVQTYLRELRRELPYPAPRLIAEAKEHLAEATAQAIADGYDEPEAERVAVEGYGSVTEVVEAVRNEGSALASPRILRWVTPLGILLSLPTAIFMAVQAIEHLAGSSGTDGVFTAPQDAWMDRLNPVIIFGPLLALFLILLSSVRVHRERSAPGLHAIVEVKLSRRAVAATVAIALVAAAVVTYGILERYEDYSAFTDLPAECEVRGASTICYGPGSAP